MSSILPAFVIGGIIVILLGVGIYVVVKRDYDKQKQALLAKQEARRRYFEQAHQDYLDSLEALKADPTNPDLKQKALSLGRAYSNLTRNQTGVTIYDEMALMNDINAATAAATVSASSVEERLAKLAELKAKGLIKESEYEARRQKVLDDI